MNTHSHQADARGDNDSLCGNGLERGMDILRQIMSSVTTDAGMEILQQWRTFNRDNAVNSCRNRGNM